jgi:hypothetical protein
LLGYYYFEQVLEKNLQHFTYSSLSILALSIKSSVTLPGLYFRNIHFIVWQKISPERCLQGLNVKKSLGEKQSCLSSLTSLTKDQANFLNSDYHVALCIYCDPEINHWWQKCYSISLSLLKTFKLGWDVARWYIACLACVRPRVWSQHQKRKDQKKKNFKLQLQLLDQKVGNNTRKGPTVMP